MGRGRPKHIPPRTLGADPAEALRRDIVVDGHGSPSSLPVIRCQVRVERTSQHFESANSERILKILIRPAPQAIDEIEKLWTRSWT